VLTSEPPEQLAVLLHDAQYASLELRVFAPTFDRFGERLLDGLIEALAFGPRERLGIGGQVVVQAHRQLLGHGVMVAWDTSPGSPGRTQPHMHCSCNVIDCPILS
jgi:hypothetical protein